MKKHLLNLIVSISAGLGFIHASGAEELSKDDLRAIATQVVQALDTKPKPENFAKYKPVLFVNDLIADFDGVTAYGVPVMVMRQEQVREAQLAWFIYLYKIDFADNKATVSYGEPSAGLDGTITLVKDNQQWVVKGKDEGHSSSGARSFYGKLYEGVTCRDGSEMARRWNSYIEIMAAMRSGKNSGKPFDDTAPASSICPGPEFPEVASYREIMKMRSKK